MKFFIYAAFFLVVVFIMAQAAPVSSNADIRVVKAKPGKPVPPPKGRLGRKEENSMLLDGSIGTDERAVNLQNEEHSDLRVVKAKPGKPVPPPKGRRGRKEN